MPSYPLDPDGDRDEDDGERGPRPLFVPAFWIALLFGLICVLAGLAFAVLGPRLFGA